MSRSFNIIFEVMHPLTEQGAVNMLWKAWQIGGMFKYGFGTFDNMLVSWLKDRSVVLGWYEEDPEDPDNSYPYVEVAMNKINDTSFEFYFQPSNANRRGRGRTSMGIDFSWYIEKGLIITEGLKIASLLAQVEDYYFKEPAQEWQVFVVLRNLYWPFGPPFFEKPNELLEKDWQHLRDTLDRFIANGLLAGCIFEPYVLDETTVSKEFITLRGKTAWGEDILVKMQRGGLWLMPADPAYRPANIRPYLELLNSLLKGFEINALQADSLALKKQ